MPGPIPMAAKRVQARTRRVRRVVPFLALSVLLACDLSRSEDDMTHRSVTRLVMATGSEDGVVHAVGTALAKAYNQRLPAVHTSVQPRAAFLSSAAVERGEVDLAFEGAGSGYRAYRQGTPEHPQPLRRLRTVAVLFPTVVHVVTRLGTMHFRDLGGKRVLVPAAGSPIEETARIVFESQGLGYSDFEPVFSPVGQVDDGLSGSSVDAAFLFVPAGHASVRRSVAHGARLVPIEADAVERIQLRSPFVRRASIPGGTYEGQPRDIQSVGTNLILICRDDLDDDLVYQLTRTLFGAAQELERAHQAAGSIDANQWATATIPLHPGAARYYRERELFR
jgi:uncharacterized protein